MNRRSLHTLEFDKIIDRLADFTDFSASRDLARALEPVNERGEVSRRQRETTEARALLDMKPGLSIAGARDIRDLLRRTLIDATLEPLEFLDILATLQSARSLKAPIARLAERFPVLNQTALHIKDAPALEREITRCISERGEVLDDASPALRRIRHDLRIAHDRLVTKLNDMLASSDTANMLQEPIITVRDDRYVFPIRAEMKGHFRGVVHDQSASGATVFMEPLATVDLNNRWRTLQLEEQHEIARIMRKLSELVAQNAAVLHENVAALAVLDMAFAKAKLSEAMRAVEPMVREEGYSALPPRVERKTGVTEALAPHEHALYLLNARHPLLTGEVVPISVYMGGNHLVLVITGPNTGGKTVALKTVGLLSVMAQAGLHIPAAEGSALPILRGVYADIGDEQSIEQSLSTFSSHLRNITEILKVADNHSLVLLDELGAGTDPVEGSALALAIIQHLLERGVMTMVATHYAELKAFAYTQGGVANASVEFDVDTLSPTYRLSIGLPGRSNALAIATRLGLSKDIIEQARRFLSSADVQVETLLKEIQREREQTEHARRQMEAERDEAGRLRLGLAAERAAIDEERRRVLAETRRQAEDEIDDVRAQLRRLMAEADAAGNRAQVAALLQQTKRVADALPQPPAARAVEAPLLPVEPVGGPLDVGDTVWVPSLGLLGEVVSLPDTRSEVEVQVGSFRTKVPATGIEKRGRRQQREAPQRVRLEAPADVPMQLDLRGWRADDVEPALDRYLNDAYLTGLPWVRIVHGKGTGVLRQVVREIVQGHNLVASFRIGDAEEGGEGVTVVTFNK